MTVITPEKPALWTPATTPTWTLHIGHVLDVLRQLPDHCVHMVVTSPPYWGLRDYGIPATVWGGQVDCEHVWGDEIPGNACPAANTGQSAGRRLEDGRRYNNLKVGSTANRGQFCSKCGAWLGVLGMEPTVHHFCANIVLLFREIRRVLRPDGTAWLNLGDTYAKSGGRRAAPKDQVQNAQRAERLGYKTSAFEQNGWDRAPNTATAGLKPKDLCLVPARAAIALQEDGWWVRSEVIWCKTNPSPSGVRDRPTQAHEQIYLLTPSKRYFYDVEAVREPTVTDEKRTERVVYGGKSEGTSTFRPANPAGRNCWDYWVFSKQGWAEEHWASFPLELPRRPILAGTSEKGCCPTCGAPWRRVVEPTEAYRARLGKSYHDHKADLQVGHRGCPPAMDEATYTTVGWEPGCECPERDQVVPCVVLDPFAGTGTTGACAAQFGRSFVGVELSDEYETQARRRLRAAYGGLTYREHKAGQLPLFDHETPSEVAS
ncbi:MAG: site-specific DNA-methyltransferase [Vulcanimicrobiota bacterium]